MCLNYDGAIFDAAVLATSAALKTTQLPLVTEAYLERARTEKDPSMPVILQNSTEGGLTTHNYASEQLQHASLPLCLSFGVVNDIIIADPTAEELGLCTTTLSVILNDKGQVLNIYKPGGMSLSDDQLKTCIHLAVKKCTGLSRMLQRC